MTHQTRMCNATLYTNTCQSVKRSVLRSYSYFRLVFRLLYLLTLFWTLILIPLSISRWTISVFSILAALCSAVEPSLLKKTVTIEQYLKYYKTKSVEGRYTGVPQSHTPLEKCYGSVLLYYLFSTYKYIVHLIFLCFYFL